MQDIRFALRQLLKSPGFTIVAVLTLGLGIGACTAIFSVVNGVLLRPLNYNEPDRLVLMRESQPPQYPEFSVAPPNFLDWQKQAQSFTALAAFRNQNFSLTGEAEPKRLAGQRVTAAFFSIYGVAPQIGRDFRPEEDATGQGKVVILSHGLWQRQFGGAGDIVGRTIQLNGEPYAILGVMPADFQPSSQTELWAPMAFGADEKAGDNRGAHYITVIGRLKPGVPLSQAQSEMDVLAGQLAKQFPDTNKGWGIRVFQFTDYTVRDVKAILWTLLGAVGCVLVIACANVANLLLARATGRMREISIRTALGAGRGRIVRQLLTESVVLALLGGALGVLIAKWGLDALLAFAPTTLPRAREIGIDGGAMGFTLALSVLTGTVFGLAPAWLATGHNLNVTLKEGTRGSTESGRRWFRSGLVATEVALSLLLLTGAGLLVRSFLKLSAVSPGFEPANGTALALALPGRKYDTPEKQRQFADQLVASLRVLPGVSAVGITHVLPMQGDYVLGFNIEGRPPIDPADLPSTNYYAVTPGYFQAMGIRLLRGRLFTEQDNEKAPRVALISETLAKQQFPNEEPLGKRINITNGPDAWREIVGIVGDVKQYGVSRESTMQSYEPFAQVPFASLTAVVRTTGDARAIHNAIRAQVFSVDKDQPVSSIKPLESIVADSMARQRFAMLLLTVFSLVALIIAAVGIYGVMAYSVSQRTNEIGIRMALGASQGSVLQLVLRQGLGVIATGLIIGLVAAFFAVRLLESMLYQTTARDPVTILAISGLLGVVALVACLIPARRATRVDPLVALRSE
jgi:putative ABC transport system permease protein